MQGDKNERASVFTNEDIKSKKKILLRTILISRVKHGAGPRASMRPTGVLCLPGAKPIHKLKRPCKGVSIHFSFFQIWMTVCMNV